MPGSTNFKQWNPNATNQEADVAYAGDTSRSGGAAVNSILPSNLGNKLFFQLTTFVTAMAQMLANKGYSPNDGSAAPGTALANLEAVLANIMTQTDMSAWALLNSPALTGVPTAPTAIASDSSTTIATTAFVRALLASVGVASFNFGASKGHISFPLFGGLILQYVIGPTDPGDSNPYTHVLTFDVVFPTACLVALVSTNAAASSARLQGWYQTINWAASGCSVERSISAGGTFDQASTAVVIAIGY